MSKLADIEKAIEQLSPEELAQLRDWLDELEARQWDEQIERDMKAGKPDKLRDAWRADYETGMHTDLVPPQIPPKR